MNLPRLHRPRLSYANVASTLALVLATSMSGAYAQGLIGSGDIRSNAVKSRHIDAGAVHTSDLGKRSVSTNRIKSGAVTRSRLDAGARPNVVGYLDPDGHDFSVNDLALIPIPGLTTEVAANNAWIVEGRNAAGSWVALPDGDSVSDYAVRVYPPSDGVFIHLTGGTGQNFTALKVVKIPINIHMAAVSNSRTPSASKGSGR